MSITNVPILATSTAIVAADDYETGPLYLENVGPVRVWLHYGSAAGVGDDEPLDPGERAPLTPSQAVYGICDSADGEVQVVSGKPFAARQADRYVMEDPGNVPQVTVGLTTAEILAENAARTYAVIQSDDANTGYIWLAYGEAAVVGEGVKLSPGQAFTIDGQAYTHLAVNGISGVAAQKVNVLEA